MQLSIIIVNYNVRFFLEQCLSSIQKAGRTLDMEVFVVDNNSPDDSVKMVRERFPMVNLIENKENFGFSVANNQAILQAKGKYILLLNPDTILSEDTLRICLDFMETHDDAGAVCVKMIDGSGQYLPESKRGKPTLSASFFKMTGIYKLFPKSGFFNAYYSGDISPNQIASIEVMTGAFMFLRQEVVRMIGLLDDTFFMYGEDIDYSYRILEAGYKNYYLPTTTIIHFKGESTRKSTFNYTRTFYNAMIIFVKKHYKKQGRFYILFLQAAVIFKAISSYFLERILKILPLLIDFGLVYKALIGLKKWWGEWYFSNPDHINRQFDIVNAPLYAGIWVLSLLAAGYYRARGAWTELLKGIMGGTGVILIIYALLGQALRNSRSIIIWGALTTTLIVIITKWLLNLLKYKRFGFKAERQIKYAIISGHSESERIRSLMSKNNRTYLFAGRICPDDSIEEGTIGNLKHIEEIVDAYALSEVVFSQKDVAANKMMESMAQLTNEVDFRVAPDDTLSIISSGDKNKQGELLTVGLNLNICTGGNKLKKRILDFTIAILLFMISPVIVLFQKKKDNFFKNIFSVFYGQKTWVGYIEPIDSRILPSIKPGVLPCSGELTENSDADTVEKENLYYARNYTWWKDLEVILKNLSNLSE
ncbi:MAG TPA: glycosyltransferase [Saprospiraceae bacterium]|nr:glycosyltransferase [Saprospiraceae bacterium]HRN34419.1 glycosyltransferase [Saprospiraceae bacterium]HRP84345.1 glycosyltransferase [Saprospiraceae bacterium]